MFPDELAYQIGQRRRRLALTIEELAAQIETVSVHTIAKWEAGKSLENYCKFLDFLDLLGLELVISQHSAIGFESKGTEPDILEPRGARSRNADRSPVLGSRLPRGRD